MVRLRQWGVGWGLCPSDPRAGKSVGCFPGGQGAVAWAPGRMLPPRPRIQLRELKFCIFMLKLGTVATMGRKHDWGIFMINTGLSWAEPRAGPR